MEKCKNHPLNNATSRCKRCHAAICNRCKMQVVDGIFCSDECIEEYRSFQSTVSNRRPSRGGFSIIGFLKNAVISAFLVALIYGIFYYWLGTGDPGEMWDKLGLMFRRMF